MKKAFLMMGVTFMMGIIIGGIPATGAAEPGLVQLLSKNLGVTEKQAAGGAGAIFNVAKQQMDDDDFTQMVHAVPDIDHMIAAAPNAETAAGMLGSASSLPGGSGSSSSGIASLSASFSQLGMKPDMVNIFIPIILIYVNEKGGTPLMVALRSILY